MIRAVLLAMLVAAVSAYASPRLVVPAGSNYYQAGSATSLLEPVLNEIEALQGQVASLATNFANVMITANKENGNLQLFGVTQMIEGLRNANQQVSTLEVHATISF